MKKLFFYIFLLFIIIFLTACGGSDGGNDIPKDYTVTIKAVNSNDDIIDTAEVGVNGNNNISKNGMLQIKLRKGTYKAYAVDKSNLYINTEQNFSVASNMIITLHMYKDSKTVTLKTVDKNTGEKIENSTIRIEGVNGTKTSEGYVATLKIGETYNVTTEDIKGYYKDTNYNFTVTEDTNSYQIECEKNSTGIVQGNLYMVSSQSSPTLLNYGFINYFDKQVSSGDTGYSIELPAGNRDIKVLTNFGVETTVSVDVVAGQTVNQDIDISLPDENNFINKWSEVKGNYDNVLTRWNKQTITYAINYTNLVKEDYDDHYLDLFANRVRDAVSYIDTVLGNVINYTEIVEYDTADIKVLVAYDGDSYIGDAGGKCGNEFNGREIIGSTITLNATHLIFNGIPIAAHEFGHSLGITHSTDVKDLMYDNPALDLNEWSDQKNRINSDRNILGLLYSMPFPTDNPFIN